MSFANSLGKSNYSSKTISVSCDFYIAFPPRGSFYLLIEDIVSLGLLLNAPVPAGASGFNGLNPELNGFVKLDVFNGKLLVTFDVELFPESGSLAGDDESS